MIEDLNKQIINEIKEKEKISNLCDLKLNKKDLEIQNLKLKVEKFKKKITVFILLNFNLCEEYFNLKKFVNFLFL